MFKVPTLPPAKKKCNKLTLDLLLERYENKDLDFLRKMHVSQNVKLFLKTLISVMNIQFLCQFWFTSKSRCFTKWLF